MGKKMSKKPPTRGGGFHSYPLMQEIRFSDLSTKGKKKFRPQNLPCAKRKRSNFKSRDKTSQEKKRQRSRKNLVTIDLYLNKGTEF